MIVRHTFHFAKVIHMFPFLSERLPFISQVGFKTRMNGVHFKEEEVSVVPIQFVYLYVDEWKYLYVYFFRQNELELESDERGRVVTGREET